ncbi:hypothetical protein [Nocardia jiangxiensis]|uniref:Uncharacterized protein n=1 Tax=Nocardia jiangxiensis TaxID=282685 RepID=A0ABW6S4S8_9NOCA|nr:hypothetical protein [Nocardia jiangxiensis]
MIFFEPDGSLVGQVGVWHSTLLLPPMNSAAVGAVLLAFPGVISALLVRRGLAPLSPHEHRALTAYCGSATSRANHNKSVSGHAVDAHYKSAEVTNLPPLRPPTGSAG